MDSFWDVWDGFGVLVFEELMTLYILICTPFDWVVYIYIRLWLIVHEPM